MPVKTKKINGKYRVVESATGEIAMQKDSPVDGGGHDSEEKAKAQVRAVNSWHEKASNYQEGGQ